jgi:hypothetical protein
LGTQLKPWTKLSVPLHQRFESTYGVVSAFSIDQPRASLDRKER